MYNILAQMYVKCQMYVIIIQSMKKISNRSAIASSGPLFTFHSFLTWQQLVIYGCSHKERGGGGEVVPSWVSSHS